MKRILFLFLSFFSVEILAEGANTFVVTQPGMPERTPPPPPPPPARTAAIVNQGNAQGQNSANPTLPRSSINDASNKSSKQNGATQILSQMIGGALTAKGASLMASNCGNPGGAALCAEGGMMVMMGMQAFQQAGSNGETKGNADTTGGQTTSGWGGLGENLGGDPVDDKDKGKPDDPNRPGGGKVDFSRVQRDLDTAKRLGLNIQKPVIGGKEFKPSDFSSPEAMAAAGISPGTIGSLMATSGNFEKLAQKNLPKDAVTKIGAHTEAQGYQEGGGSSGSSGGSSSGAGSYSAGAGGLGGEAHLRDPAGSNLAGLSKNFNGDPIGVAADSIFLMMNRRYQLKEKQNTFIESR